MSKNYCDLEHLVGMGFTIAKKTDSALSKEEIDSENLRGCGNLKCDSCGYEVKYWDNKRWKTPMGHLTPRLPATPQEAERIEAHQRRANEETRRTYLGEISALVASPRTRAYGCLCLSITVQNYQDAAEFGTPLQWWHCQGHKTAE